MLDKQSTIKNVHHPESHLVQSTPHSTVLSRLAQSDRDEPQRLARQLEVFIVVDIVPRLGQNSLLRYVLHQFPFFLFVVVYVYNLTLGS